MRKNVMPIILVLGTLCVGLLYTCEPKKTIQPPRSIAIIPQPNSVVEKQGVFEIENRVYVSSCPEFEQTASFLKQYLTQIGIASTNTDKNKTIQLTKDLTIKNKEGYELNISSKHIEIKAKTEAGAFYAVQTLRQLLPPKKPIISNSYSTISIPAIEIKDAPVFSYRGMHLDVSRNYFPISFIKSYIDALALLKMNTFHWHLTDDQGWRIEINQFPKLQSVAAFRDQTLVGHYNKQPQHFDRKRHGGYYTQEEVKEIVAYAQQRQITIIPEIEMPGHSLAAIAAYPHLSCQEQPVAVAQKWGVFETIYCTKEPVFDFLETVLDEVVTLFPGPYIHIGGDEAPKTQWKLCSSCKKRMREEKLKDENALQAYFIQRIENYLNSKGKQIIGWDEILEGSLAKNATVMSWRGTNGAIEAAKQGHNVIMTPTSHCYFDYYQSDHEDEPLAIGGYLPLEKVYAFNPIPEELTELESKYILGAQGNVWTEYMSTPEQVEYMLFPRILAMSEVLWTRSELKNYEIFSKNVERFQTHLEALGYTYANHFYDIQGRVTNKTDHVYMKLQKASNNYNIYYSTDALAPTFSKDHQFKGPILIDKSMTVKAQTFNALGKPLGNLFTKTVNLHKGIGQEITFSEQPNKTYVGSGAQGLINGVSGSDKRYGDNEWVGFWGKDVVITIELKNNTPINSVETRFYNANGQWIYTPKQVSLELYDSLGGKITEGKLEFTTDHTTGSLFAKSSIALNGLNAKVIKIFVENFGVIPDGKQGAGQNAWTFIDEIFIL